MADVRKKELGAVDATLFASVAMLGIRWLPVAAVSGPGSLPLWFLAFLTFYLPLSAATAEMTSRFAGEGSLYVWSRDTNGPLMGFLCGWFYWISLFPYFASTVYFLSGLLIGVAGGDTHDTRLYLAVSLAITLFASAFQLFGLRIGKWLTNFGAAGSWLVFALIAVVAIMIARAGGGATDFAHSSWLLPANFDTAILWGTVVFGLCGSETVSFLRDDMKGGMRSVVRVLVAVGLILVFVYMAGTAAMLAVLPKAELTRLSGLPDAIHAAFARVGLPSLSPLAIALFALSLLGGFTAWFGIGTKLPMEAGIDSFLPPVFAQKNAKTGAPTAAILLQGALILFVVALSQAGEGAAEAYDFLVSMSVLTVTIPYIFVFIAYFGRKRWPESEDAWLPPGGATTGLVLGLVGLVSTLIATACCLVPSGSDPHPLTTFLKIVFATGGAVLVGLILYALGTRRQARVALAGGDAA
jgi:amino acid transporter